MQMGMGGSPALPYGLVLISIAGKSADHLHLLLVVSGQTGEGANKETLPLLSIQKKNAFGQGLFFLVNCFVIDHMG